MLKNISDLLSRIFSPRVSFLAGFDDKEDLAPELPMSAGTPLPCDSEHLKVIAVNALVDIKRVAELTTINWSVNRPDSWSVTADGAFTQTRHESGSMNMDGTKVVFRDGIQVVFPGRGLGYKSADRILIELPVSYCGSLTVDFSGVSMVRIESWNGSCLELNSDSLGSLELGDVRSSESVIIDLKNSGDAEIYSIRAKTVEIDLRDSGDVTARAIYASRLAKINAFSDGDTEIDKLVCGEIDVHATGSGDVLVSSGSAQTGFVFSDDDGEVTLLGDFSAVYGEFNDED